jgi:signal transduction histidine kinase
VRPDLPGHGLGLASVRAVMQLHGGSMRLEPARPGLRVALRLPQHTP